MSHEGLFTNKKDAVAFEKALVELVSLAEASGNDATRVINAIDDMEMESSLTWVDFVEYMGIEDDDLPPTVGQIIDGMPLFYRGCVNMAFGTDSVGKSIIMAALALEELRRGETVIWVDFEEQTPRILRERFRAMGADPSEFENFRAFFCTRKLRQQDVESIMNQAADASLVVLDSVGEYLAMQGANENWDNDVSAWLFQHFARPIAAVNEDGPAVVLIDHTKKDDEEAGASAGSKRKRAGLTGASYRISVVDGEGWSRNKAGEATVTCVKDRRGFRERGERVATVEVRPLTEDRPLTVKLLAGDEIDAMLERPTEETDDAQKVIDFLAASGNGHSMASVRRELALSKDATSRLMTDLEERGVILKRSGAWFVIDNLHSV